MSRIAAAFNDLKAEGKKGFIPFIVGGHPDLERTGELLVELGKAGATVIELGIPFSDPMADGPVIQRASESALRHGLSIEDVLRTVRTARREIDTPIVLFSYFNPLMQFGLERLANEAAAAGCDGVLVTDLTPEESVGFGSRLRACNLDQIFLVAPTTTDERLRFIAERASGFIYAVSRAGVTGMQASVNDEAAALVARVRMVSTLPVAVGFGISSREQVTEVLRYADAAVVGSAIVAQIENSDASDLASHIGRYARGLMAESN